MPTVSVPVFDGFSKLLTSAKRVGLALIAVVALGWGAAAAASPAEQYVNDNMQKGLSILNNKSLSKEQRRDQLQDFLTGLVDLKRVADYTLGQYRRGAPPADLAAFETAYKDYALAAYRVYFDKFSGQTLQITGAYPLQGDESVVKTILVDPARAQKKPLAVNFRIGNAGGKYLVTDISVEGVWLRQTQRDDFTSFLGQNGGDLHALVAMLKNKAKAELHAK